jgi:hypothetical protein
MAIVIGQVEEFGLCTVQEGTTEEVHLQHERLSVFLQSRKQFPNDPGRKSTFGVPRAVVGGLLWFFHELINGSA